MRKTTLLIFVMISFITNISYAQDDYTIINKEYNGEEYVCFLDENIHSITNLKNKIYIKYSARDSSFDNETEEQYDKRRKALTENIYTILDDIFHFANIPIKEDDLNILQVLGIFDYNTKDFVGAKYIFDSSNEPYFTFDKIQLADNRLMQAGLNLGKSFTFNVKKYITYTFIIFLGVIPKENNKPVNHELTPVLSHPNNGNTSTK